jgi:hypothetical protein
MATSKKKPGVMLTSYDARGSPCPVSQCQECQDEKLWFQPKQLHLLTQNWKTQMGHDLRVTLGKNVSSYLKNS